MDNYPDEISKIKKFLKKDPWGMNIRQIAEGLKINRNSVSKYLDILTAQEEVTFRTFGKSKVYYLSQRVPISDLMKFASNFIIVLNRDLRIVQLNDAFLRHINLPKEKLLGSKITEIGSDLFCDPDFFSLANEAITGKEMNMEIQVKINSVYLFYKVTLTPTIFQDQSRGVIVVFENITERKWFERALKESEEKYRTIFENAGDAIAIHDIEGHFVEVNDVICRRIGYTREELLKMRVGDVDGPVHASEVDKRIAELTKKGNIIFETVHIARDGRQIPTEVSAVLFHLGNTPLVMSIARDVTDRKRAEIKLAYSQKQIEFILGATKTGIDIIDSDFNLRYVDAEWQKVYGNPEGRKCYEYFMGRTEECPGCGIPKALAGKTPVVTEEILVREGNRPIQVTTIPFQNENGEWLVAEVNVDITELKDAQEELKRKQREMAAVLKGLRGVVVDYLDPSLTILWANEEMAEEFGIPLSEVCGKHCYEVIQNRNERCPDCPAYTATQVQDISEKEVTLPDGRLFLVRCNPVMDEKGSVAGVVHAMINITEHKRAEDALRRKNTELHAAYEQLTAGEEELRQSFDELSKKEQMVRESENNLKAILESLQSALVIIDPKTHIIIDVNSVAIRMIGAPREEIIGHVCHKYICPADVGNCPISDLKQTIDLSERILLNAKGERIPILKSVTPKIISGHEYFVENLIDITERKRMEDALALASQKLNLLSSITRHDILNLLTALNGYLEISTEFIRNPDKIADLLQKEKHIAKMIEHQISFTRDYHDLGVNAPAWQNVHDTVMRVQVQLPMRHIKVDTDRNDLEVFADPLLEKVFYNLIDNALRYGGDAMTAIRIFSWESDPSLVIVCEDDGAGISAEDKMRLFTRGFGRHTGYGLFLSREILGITGLTIAETSIPGKGARFEITVPKGLYRFTGVQ